MGRAMRWSVRKRILPSLTPRRYHGFVFFSLSHAYLMLADLSGLLLLFLKHAVSSTHCLVSTGPPGRRSLIAHQDGDKQEAFTDRPGHRQHGLCSMLVQSSAGQRHGRNVQGTCGNL